MPNLLFFYSSQSSVCLGAIIMLPSPISFSFESSNEIDVGAPLLAARI